MVRIPVAVSLPRWARVWVALLALGLTACDEPMTASRYDILLLVGTLARQPAALGVQSAGDWLAATAIVSASAIGAIGLALVTYAAGSRFADAVLGPES